jgi:type 1 glutamine amidotransferase
MTKRRKAITVLLVLTVSAGLLSSSAEAAHKAPAPRRRVEVEGVLAKAPKPPAAGELRQLHVVLLAFKKDHGKNEHDYPLWQKRWAPLLGAKEATKSTETQVNLYGPPPAASPDLMAGAPKVKVSTAWNWPSEEQFQSANLIVMFRSQCWSPKALKDMEAFLARGGGLVIIHMVIWQDSKPLADMLGMAKGKGTRYRHGAVDLKIADPKHPITLGLPERVHFMDETYYNFQGDASKVTVLATCDEQVGGKKRPEPMFWTHQRGKGRVFVCILGHFIWTFDDPYFRILLLRGMAWAAGESPYRFDPLVLRGAAVK